MSAAERTSPRRRRWHPLLALAGLLCWPVGAQAAGGVLNGKLADDALAGMTQHGEPQARRGQLDSHLADSALAEVPWSPPPRQTQQQRSAFAGLQESLRAVPPAEATRTPDKRAAASAGSRKPDLTSVLADLKAATQNQTGSNPQSADATRKAAAAVPPAAAGSKTLPVAKALPPPTQAAIPPAAPRATTGLLTGLRLLPPDRLPKTAPAIAAAEAPAARVISRSSPAAPKPDSVSAPLPASATPAAPTPSIIIEVLPPLPATASAAASAPEASHQPPVAAAPSQRRAAAVTGILTGLRLLPVAQPLPAAAHAKNLPPQAFRTREPPDKMPLFITARSGEAVKLAPPRDAAIDGKAMADAALSAYTTVTPRDAAEPPLHFRGLDLNLAVSPPDEPKGTEAPKAADPPEAAPAAPATQDVAAAPATEAELKKKASDEAQAALSPADGHPAPDLRQELWKEWAEKVTLLEEENKALRGELAHSKADPLQDIRVDAVAKIKEQVLRERIAELEKEVLEAQNKVREAALNDAAKKAADAALAPPPAPKDIPVKP